MAGRTTSRIVNGILLLNIMKQLEMEQKNIFDPPRPAKIKGNLRISRRNLQDMLAGQKPIKIDQVREVVNRLKKRGLYSLEPGDLYQENARTIEDILRREQDTNQDESGSNGNTSRDVEVPAVPLRENHVGLMPQIDTNWWPSDENRAIEIPKNLTQAIIAMNNSLLKAVAGVMLCFTIDSRNADAKRELASNLEDLLTAINATGKFIINELQRGSIVVVATMAEVDAVSMIRAFSQGRLDDLDLSHIAFTQLTPKLEAALSEIERSPDVTRIKLKRGITGSAATMYRVVAPRTTEQPAKPGSLPANRPARIPTSPITRRRGRKQQPGMIPSDQIGGQKPGRSKLLDYSIAAACLVTMVFCLAPAFLAAREKAARAQCANNLRQIGIACHKYADIYSTLPPGAMTLTNPITGKITPGFSSFVRILPCLEQQAVFDGFNFSLTEQNTANITGASFHLSVLDCPSDPKPSVQIDGSFGISPIPKAGNFQAHYASYAGCQGIFPLRNPDESDAPDRRNLAIPVYLNGDSGPIFPNSRYVYWSSITDGTSNTFMFGEHSKSLLAKHSNFDTKPRFAWHSGYYLDTQFSTMYPLNLQNTMKTGPRTTAAGQNYQTAATSNHSKGANFLCCDASVVFVSNRINSWSFAAGNKDPNGAALPDGMTYDTKSKKYTFPTVSAGDYQALSTRASGEIITPDPLTIEYMPRY